MLAYYLYNAQQFTTAKKHGFNLECIKLSIKDSSLCVEATSGENAYRATLGNQIEWLHAVNLNISIKTDTLYLQKIGKGKLRKPDPRESVMIHEHTFNCLGCDWKVTTDEAFPNIDKVWHDGNLDWDELSPNAFDAMIWSLKKTKSLRKHLERGTSFPHRVEIKHFSSNSVFASVALANTVCLTSTCDTGGNLLHHVVMDGAQFPELLGSPDSIKFWGRQIFFRSSAKEEYCVLPIITLPLPI